MRQSRVWRGHNGIRRRTGSDGTAGPANDNDMLKARGVERYNTSISQLMTPQELQAWKPQLTLRRQPGFEQSRGID